MPLPAGETAIWRWHTLGAGARRGTHRRHGKSPKAHEDFFALWKGADPDLPILIEAKKEYQKLR